MERYSEYKDSGVKWLGEIPSHWETVKTKYIWQEQFAKSENGTEDLLSVSQFDGVTPTKSESRSESLKGYKIVEENDLVVNIMLAWMGGLGISAYKGIVSPAYCIYKLTDDSNPKYMHYLYKTPTYLAEFARHSTGVIPSRWRMYTDDFGQVLTLIPPRKEQDLMVEYLDSVIVKIDEAIAQQQKMIELLNERKQIIINNAVTKGLDPNVPMKDSGVDWIGKIPCHWVIKSLKHIAKTNKTLINPKERAETIFHDYSMPAFDASKVCFDIVGKELESSKLLLTEDTLLINKLNVHKQRIWFVSKPEYNSVASTEFVPFTIFGANAHFVEYYFLSSIATDYLISYSYGATNSQKRVSPDLISSTKIPIPPKEEQSRIVDYINMLIAPLNSYVEITKNKIIKLQERKQIIINEVVTGKVKVS
jgi:type I restriction enzyme S subunit